MKQTTLANWLKGIIIGMGLCGLVIFIWILPNIIDEFLLMDPTKAGWKVPWRIVMWVSAVPCFAVLGFGWLIANNIGHDKSFSSANAHYLKMISLMAIIDCVFFFGANVTLFICNMNHPAVMIASLFVVFAGIVIAVAAAALSHLVLKAALLQEQSDLTI